MNEIDWIQFHKQTKAMEAYLHFQQELETKRSRPAWISAWKKGQHPSINQIRFDPSELPELIYEKWLEIASMKELDGYYVDNATMYRLQQYEKHSKLVGQNAL